MSAWAADGLARRGLGEAEDEGSDGEAGLEGNGAAGGMQGGDGDNEDGDKSHGTGVVSFLLRALVCVLTGIVFGFVTEKSRVFEPMNIRGQMVFRRLVYLKTMLSSVASGMFGLSMMAMLPGTHFKFQRACNAFYGRLLERGILACAVGGLIMGCGVTLAGSCPMVLFVQLGADVPQAWYTLAGALAGTLLYALLKSKIDGMLRPIMRSSTNPWAESSYFITALPLVAMFSMLVFAFDILIPWELEVRNRGEEADSYLERRVWPPYLTGVIIGLLQLPLVIGAEQTLGGSTCYITVIAQFFIGPLRRLSPSLGRHRWGFRNWWQVYYVCGALIGAYLSASVSDSFATVRGIPVNHALLGGTLMAIGAHVAGGGAYEHGVTGMGLLSILSFIMIAATFTGSICTAVTMRRYRILSP